MAETKPNLRAACLRGLGRIIYTGLILGGIYGFWFKVNVMDSRTKQYEDKEKNCDDSHSDQDFKRSSQKSSHLLPLRTVSNIWGKINSYYLPVWLRPSLFDLFCRAYSCDMSEALVEDYKSYRNLGEFFTRRLRPEARPISQEPGIVSPADGLIVHFGPIKNGQIEDVKELNYSVQAFLGDCHRFQSPTQWIVNLRKHFPGRLFSVHPNYMKKSPEILHVNERVSYFGDWKYGYFSMTAVGATNVGSIKVVFDEDLRTNRFCIGRAEKYGCFEKAFDKAIDLKPGQDFGHFNFGSTIVLIFEAPKNSLFKVKNNQKIKYGQQLVIV